MTGCQERENLCTLNKSFWLAMRPGVRAPVTPHIKDTYAKIVYILVAFCFNGKSYVLISDDALERVLTYITGEARKKINNKNCLEKNGNKLYVLVAS